MTDYPKKNQLMIMDKNLPSVEGFFCALSNHFDYFLVCRVT